MRPLDRFATIKSKLSFVIVFAVGVTVVIMLVALRYVLPRPPMPWWQLVGAGAVSAGMGLGLARVIARGLTKPLRDMATAAERFGRGDHSARVERRSNDEVGNLADAFNDMIDKLEQQERLRRELLANVSHELKTPLAALQAHMENLVDGVEHLDRELIELLLTQTTRLGGLVDQLLDLEKLDSGDLRLRQERVPVHQLVSRVTSEVSVLRDPASVVNQVPDDLNVVGDPERLHQVLLNLIDNALRFSPAGGRVVVSARENGDRVLVDVRDEGPGVPAGENERIFERFYRGDTARARRDGGAGIGLAIVRSIVHAHGGAVEVTSNGSPGATFRVSVPTAGMRQDG